MSRRQPLPNLTTVRLIAALYVFLFHFTSAGHHGFLRYGFTGVSLFFVLSGFILAYNYPVVPDRRRFFALRFARIYPAYALALLILLPRTIHGAGVHLSGKFALEMIACFAMLQSWWPPIRGFINTAAWTLPVEAFFYLTFPFLLPWATRQQRHIVQWTSLLGVLLLVPPILVLFVFAPVHPGEAAIVGQFLFLPLFRLAEFVVGIFFGIRFLERHPAYSGRHVALAVLLCVAWTMAALRIRPQYEQLVVNGLMAIPYVLLLYTLAGWESRWFAHPLLQLGGEISYSFYLLQFPASFLVRWSLHSTSIDTLHFVLTLLLACGASYASYRLLEKPARVAILRALGYSASAKPIPTPGLQV